MNNSPILFSPNIHTALWGCESWVISAHRAGESMIRTPPFEERGLSSLYPSFPLLFKVIDARDRLSVQVHPNENTCRTAGGEPKTEMWCVISGGPIFAGLKSGVTKEEVAEAAADGRFENLLVRHDAQPGDVFFIPGGLVHAIGEGVKLFEVQQSSDTTFRLYDWGRKDAEGRSRELHIEQAMKAIDLTLDVPTPQKSIESRFFNFSQMRLDGTVRVKSGEDFLAVFNAGGDVSLDRTELPCGDAALLPPGTDATLSGCGAWVMTTSF
jgi:mannose-6-phosphate isomerase